VTTRKSVIQNEQGIALAGDRDSFGLALSEIGGQGEQCKRW
jgi:hypothetical protein